MEISTIDNYERNCVSSDKIEKYTGLEDLLRLPFCQLTLLHVCGFLITQWWDVFVLFSVSMALHELI